MGGIAKRVGGGGAGAFGAMKAVRPESEVLQAYADSTGVLVAPYEYLDGSGWWRPRYTFALNHGTPCYVSAPKDLAILGGPFTNTLDAIEGASALELEDLAVRQRDRFAELSWTLAEWQTALDKAMRYGL